MVIKEFMRLPTGVKLGGSGRRRGDGAAAESAYKAGVAAASLGIGKPTGFGKSGIKQHG